MEQTEQLEQISKKLKEEAAARTAKLATSLKVNSFDKTLQSIVNSIANAIIDLHGMDVDPEILDNKLQFMDGLSKAYGIVYGMNEFLKTVVEKDEISAN